MKQLFLGIYRILYEPFFIGALLAILSILLFYVRKRNIWFIAASCPIVFMVAWRFICHSLMLSSRYSAILIFPALLLVAWLCPKMGVYFRRFFPSKWGGKWKSPFCHLLEAASVLGMMIGCFGQILHFNPYANWFNDVVSVYQQNANNDDIIYAQDNARIAFYTHKTMRKIRYFPSEDIKQLQFISAQLQLNKNIPGKYYFFFSKKKNQPEPTAEMLKLAPQDGSWKILARSFVSRRKKKEFILALFEPGCPNIEEWNSPIPPIPGDDLYKRIGEFETRLSPQQQKITEERFKKLGIPAYSNLSGKNFPYGVGLGLGKADIQNPPDIHLQTHAPLAGKYSLYVDAASPKRPAGFNLPSIRQKHRYCFFVRGEGNTATKLIYLPIAVNQKNNSQRQYVERLYFLIQPGKTYRISGQVTKEIYPQQTMYPVFNINGRVTIDQFSVVPIK